MASGGWRWSYDTNRVCGCVRRFLQGGAVMILITSIQVRSNRMPSNVPYCPVNIDVASRMIYASGASCLREGDERIRRVRPRPRHAQHVADRPRRLRVRGGPVHLEPLAGGRHRCRPEASPGEVRGGLPRPVRRGPGRTAAKLAGSAVRSLSVAEIEVICRRVTAEIEAKVRAAVDEGWGDPIDLNTLKGIPEQDR